MTDVVDLIPDTRDWPQFWVNWCEYTNAVDRQADTRGRFMKTQFANSDRFWWADRDYQRKRTVYLNGEDT